MAHRPMIGLVVAIAFVSPACTARRKFPAPNLPASAALVPADAKSEHAVIRQASQSAEPTAAKQRTVLAVSGGGLYGAYAAGVLKGWTASGTRPKFDVVTGISTGALVATGAFLGPEYDSVIENVYTTVETRDVFRRHWLPAMFWSDSVADSRPLLRLIESAITPQALEEIAAQHRAGRRLYVGTNNLDTTRLVVWDMGAIAAGDDPNKLELFRKLLLASCSVPGLLPPVPIDIEIDGKRHTELHVDGGVSTMVFIQDRMLQAPGEAADKKASNTTVYVLIAGKLEADGPPVRRRLVSVALESMNGLFRARHRADLERIHQIAHDAGAKFGFAAIPDEVQSAVTSVAFDPKLMRQLFDAGYQFAVDGPVWNPNPPGLDPEDQTHPRTGVRFSAVEGGGSP
jgi:predicted acylesterase/phospholipase RssA